MYGKNLISVYIKNPGQGIVDLYRYLITAIGFTKIQRFVKEVVGAMILRFLQDNRNTSEEIDYCEILDKYMNNLSPDFLSTKISNLYGIMPDFASAISFLALNNEIDLSWKWLRANKLGPSEMRKINVLNSLSTTEHIEEAILSLLKLMYAYGYRIVFLMLDEIEDLLNIKDENARIRYLRSIRRIIDNTPTKFGLFFACTEDGWREILLNYQPLASRLARGNFMQLFNLTYSETREFIADYLSPYRTKKSLNREFPFEEGSIKLIHEYSNGIPREIIKACALSIEQGLNKGSRLISEEIVKQALSPG